MRRFITLTLAVLVGAATASLRLGEYCDTNASCNSGLCYQGVCRAGSDNSTMPALATKMMRVAAQQRGQQLRSELKGALVNKIISFSKQAEAGNMHQRFKSYLGNDVQQNSLDSQFRAKLAANVRAFSSSSASDDNTLQNSLDSQFRAKLAANFRAFSSSSASDDSTLPIIEDVNSRLRQSLMSMMIKMNAEAGAADNQTEGPAQNQTQPPADNQTEGPSQNQTETPSQNQTVPVNQEAPAETPSSYVWIWILIIVGVAAAGLGGVVIYKRKRQASADGYNKVTA